jgi:hypothetical protein
VYKKTNITLWDKTRNTKLPKVAVPRKQSLRVFFSPYKSLRRASGGQEMPRRNAHLTLRSGGNQTMCTSLAAHFDLMMVQLNGQNALSRLLIRLTSVYEEDPMDR